MPIIGITCDTVAGHSPSQWKYESPHSYAQCVAVAGGLPVLLPYETSCIARYMELCDGFLLSGGDDPDMVPFGEPTHPKAKVLHHRRQEFESALIRALEGASHPVLGICLGMQMMALHAGGKLHQHMPEAPGIGPEKAALHQGQSHLVQLCVAEHGVLHRGGTVFSKHNQSVADAGGLRVVAESGGVVEAVDRPGARFYLGVQWHPERTEDEAMGQGLITKFVKACAAIRPA